MSGVFVSYRRSDSAGHTGRLADYLGQQLEDHALFRDIEKIQAGEDFVEVLERAVAACSVMLVVIGPQWAKVETPDGKRRLKQPGDFVRMEIETALARGVRVIPVLVGDANMPEPEDLPESMAPLLRRHAHTISDRRWAYDLGELIEVLRKVPGVSFRADAVQAQPAKAGMATWMKVAIGSAVLCAGGIPVLLTLGILGTVLPGPAATPSAAPGSDLASLGAPVAAAAAASTSVSGAWRDEQDMPWYFEQTGGKLVVSAGSAVDAARLPPRRPKQETADSDFADLRGEGKIEGQSVAVKLRDAGSGKSSSWAATVSPDGRSIEGEMTDEGDPTAFSVTLRRD
jgi:hypothetical protein